MRSILSVVNMSNETEIDDGTLPNTTQYESNQTIGSSECGIWNEEYQIISSTVQWWCEGALFSVVGLIGLVVNILSVGILSTRELRKHTFNQLLIAHCLIDIGFIMVSVPVYTYNLVFVIDTSTMLGQIFIQLYVTALYPLSAVMLCASVYMTVAITIERYLAVCRPIFYRNLTRTMTSTRRVALYVTPVLLVSSCLNIPKFMETQTSSGSSEEQTNGTSSDNTTETIKVQAADIRLDPTYMLYYTISQIFHPTLTTGIAPMVALIFMNTSIFFGIRKTVAARNQRRGPASAHSNGANENRLAVNQTEVMERGGGFNNNQQQSAASALANNASPRPAAARDNRKTETNLAVVLIGITTMHLVCHALRVFLATYAVYLNTTWVNCMKTEGAYLPPLWTMCAEHISSIMIMLNLAGNFLIYCSVLKPFKAYLSDKCGSSAWLKLFRRFTEFVHSPRRDDDNNRNNIILTNPPHIPVRNEINNGIDSSNPVFTTNQPIADLPNLQNETHNGRANPEEVAPLLRQGDAYVNNIGSQSMTLTSGNTEPNIEKENSKSHENEPANDKERLSSNKQDTVASTCTNEPAASLEKPQSSRTRGLGSSMRLKNKKMVAKAGRGLSFLSHFPRKSNDEGTEDSLSHCNGNRSKRVKSDGDLKIKGSKSSAINKKPNLISEDDIQDVEEGMQQLLVESEGGTVLFESTNIQVIQNDYASNEPFCAYENQNCGPSLDACLQADKKHIHQVKPKNKRDGFSQT